VRESLASRFDFILFFRHEDGSHDKGERTIGGIGQERSVPLLVFCDLIEAFDRGSQVGKISTGGLSEALRPEGRDGEGRMGTLVRLKSGTFGARVVSCPKGQHPVEGLVESVSLFRRGNPKCFEHRLLESAPKADQESALRDLVESCDLSRDLFWGVEGEKERGCAQFQSTRCRRIAGQLDEGSRADTGLKMHLREPNRVKTHRFREFDPGSMRAALLDAMNASERKSKAGSLKTPGGTRGF
jgi:hypothetical protein